MWVLAWIGVSLLPALLPCSTAQDDAARWEAFKTEFGKRYNATEDARRFALFQSTLHDLDSATSAFFQLQLYNWSDWTPEEFRARRANTNVSIVPPEDYEAGLAVDAANELDEAGKLPGSVDWRCNTTNPMMTTAVTPIKDQGNCGSCWAFAANAVAEAAGAVAEGLLMDLSTQQVLDCNERGYGCGGGTVEAAMAYYLREGLEQSEDYPQIPRSAAVCTANSSLTVSTASQLLVSAESESAVLRVLHVYGPVTATVKAGCSAFSNYKSGVLTEGCTESCANLDHAVAIVGYGYDNHLGLPYFIVRNSWGEDWGESGYVRMLRTGDGVGLSGLLCENFGVREGDVVDGVQESYGGAEMNSLYAYCSDTLPHVGSDDTESALELLTGDFLWALIIGVFLFGGCLGAGCFVYARHRWGSRRYQRHEESFPIQGNLGQGLNPDEERRHAAMVLSAASISQGNGSRSPRTESLG